MSSLREGHANVLRIVANLTDVTEGTMHHVCFVIKSHEPIVLSHTKTNTFTRRRSQTEKTTQQKYLHSFTHLVGNLISWDGGLGHLAPLPSPDVQSSLGIRIGDSLVSMHVHGRGEPSQRPMVCVPSTPILFFFLVFVVLAAIVFLVAAAGGGVRGGWGRRVAIVDAIADVSSISEAV